MQKLTVTILNPETPVHTLRPEVIEIGQLLANSQNAWKGQRADIAVGETPTSHGLAISPTMAAMCAEDYARTVQFLRGTHAAITEIRALQPKRPVRILYAGCGPLGLLATPLMTLFSSAEASFTLLDVHAESIESVRGIVEGLGLSDRVAAYERINAMSYRVDPDALPDIILIEVMQACLEREPQVALTRHLLRQAPGAILIPEDVRIELVLVDPALEFDLEGSEEKSENRRDRVNVAPLFILNRETVESWSEKGMDVLPGAVVRLPDRLDGRYQLMLFTRVCTYRDHILEDYDSGLTCPRVLGLDRPVRGGDVISFSFELGSHPRLISEVEEPISDSPKED